jgi:hypothetical protein
MGSCLGKGYGVRRSGDANKILRRGGKFFLPAYVPQPLDYGVAGLAADNTHLLWGAKFSY